MSSPIGQSPQQKPLHEFKGFVEIEGQKYEWTYQDPRLLTSQTRQINKADVDAHIHTIIDSFFKAHTDLKAKHTTCSEIKGVWYKKKEADSEVALQNYDFTTKSAKAAEKEEIKQLMGNIKRAFEGSLIAPSSSSSLSQAGDEKDLMAVQAQRPTVKTSSSSSLGGKSKGPASLQGRIKPLSISPTYKQKQIRQAIRTNTKEKQALRNQVSSLQTQLSSAQVQLRDIGEQLAQKDSRVTELSQQLVEKDAQILQLQGQIISERDAIIAEREAIVHERTSREQQLSSLQSQVGELSRELSVVREEKIALQSQLESLSGRHRELTEGFAQRESQLLRQISALKASRTQLRINSRKVAPLTRQIHSLTQQLEGLRRDHTALNLSYSSLRATHDALIRTCEEQGTIINDLGRELRLSQDQNLLKERDLGEATGRIRALEEEKARLTQEHQASLAQLNSQIGGLRGEIHRLESLEGANRQQIKSLRGQLEQKITEFSLLQEGLDRTLAEKNQAIASKTRDIDRLTQDLAVSRASEGSLREQITAIGRQKDEALRREAEANQRCAVLEEQRRPQEALIESLRVQLQQKDQLLLQAADEQSSLLSQLSTAGRANETALRTIESLKAENTQLSERLRDAESINQELRIENSRLTDTLSVLISEKERLQGNLQRQGQALENSLREKSELEGTLRALEESSGRLQIQIVGQESEIGRLRDLLEREQSSSSERTAYLQSELSRANELLAPLRTLRSEQEATIQRLSTQLSASQEQVRQLQQGLDQGQIQLQERDRTIASIEPLRQQNESFARKLSTLERTKRYLTEELASMTLSYEGNAAQLLEVLASQKQNETTIQELRETKTLQEEQLGTLRQRLQGTEHALSSLQQQFSAFREENTVTLASLEAFKQRALSSERESERLSSLLQGKEAELTSIQGAFQEERTRLLANITRLEASLDSQNQSLQQTIGKQRLEINSLSQDKLGLSEQVDTLRASISEIGLRNDALQADVETKERTLQGLTARLRVQEESGSQKDTDLAGLRQEIATIGAALEEQRGLLETSTTQQEALKTQLRLLQGNLERKTSELQTKNEALQELQIANERLTARIEALDAEKAQALDSLRGSQEAFERQFRENSELKASLEANQKELGVLEASGSASSQEIDRLEETIGTLRQTLATKEEIALSHEASLIRAQECLRTLQASSERALLESQQQRQSLEAAVGRLQDNLRLREEELAQLRTTSEVEKRGLQGRVKELEDLRGVDQLSLDQKQREILALQEINTGLVARNGTLEEELVPLQENRLRLESSLRLNQERLEALEQTLKDKDLLLVSNAQLLSSLQAEKEALSLLSQTQGQDLQRIQLEIQSLGQELTASRQTIASQEKIIGSQKVELEASRESQRVLQENLSTALKENRASKEIFDNLTSALETLKREKSKVEADFKGQTEALALLKGQEGTNQEAILQLQSSVGALEATLAENAVHIQSLEESLRSAETRLRLSNEQLEQVKKEAKEQLGSFDAKTEELSRAAQEISTLRKALAPLQEEFAALKDEKAHILREKAISQLSFTEKEQALQQLLAVANKKIQELEAAQALSLEALGASTNKSKALELQLAQSQQEADTQLQKAQAALERIATLTAELESRPTQETTRSLQAELVKQQLTIIELQEALALQTRSNSTLQENLAILTKKDEGQTATIALLRSKIEKQTSEYTASLLGTKKEQEQIALTLKGLESQLSSEEKEKGALALEIDTLRKALKTSNETISRQKTLLLQADGALTKASLDLEKLRQENIDAIGRIREESRLAEGRLTLASQEALQGKDREISLLKKEKESLQASITLLAQEFIDPSLFSSKELVENPEGVLNALKGKIVPLTELNARLESQKAELNQTVDRLTEELLQLRENLTGAKQESVDALASKLAVDDELILKERELTAAKKDLLEANQTLQESKKLLNSMLRAVPHESVSLEEEMLLETDSDSIVTKLQVAKLRLEARQRTIEVLEDQISQLQTDVEETTSQDPKVIQENEALKAQLFSLRQTLAAELEKGQANQEEIGKLRAHIASIEHAATAQQPFIKEEKERIEAEKQQLQGQISILKAQQEVKQRVIGDLKADLKVQKEEMQRLDQANLKLDDDNFFLGVAVKRHEAQIKALTKSIGEKEASLKVLQTDHQELESHYQILILRFQKKERENQQLIRENAELEQALEPKKEQTRLFLDTIEDQLEIIEARQETIDRLTQEISALHGHQYVALRHSKYSDLNAEQVSLFFKGMHETIASMRESLSPDIGVQKKLRTAISFVSDYQIVKIRNLFANIEVLKTSKGQLEADLAESRGEIEALETRNLATTHLLEAVAQSNIDVTRQLGQLEYEREQILETLSLMTSEGSLILQNHGESALEEVSVLQSKIIRPLSQEELAKIDEGLSERLATSLTFNRAPDLKISIDKLKEELRSLPPSSSSSSSEAAEQYSNYLKVALGISKFESLPKATQSALATENADITELKNFAKGKEDVKEEEVVAIIRKHLVALETSLHPLSMDNNLTDLKNIRFFVNAMKALNKSSGLLLSSSELKRLQSYGCDQINAAITRLRSQ